jgi:hypothetical protein
VGGWSTLRPGHFTPGKETRYTLYRRLGGPQGRSGWAQKISPPPGFDPWTVQPIASCYTDWATCRKVKGPDRSWGFQEVKARRFQNNNLMKVVMLSALHTGCLYPQEIYLVFISVTGWVNTRAVVWLEGICQWEIQMTPLGIKDATFWLVA